jgi:hypothetical protein
MSENAPSPSGGDSGETPDANAPEVAANVTETEKREAYEAVRSALENLVKKDPDSLDSLIGALTDLRNKQNETAAPIAPSDSEEEPVDNPPAKPVESSSESDDTSEAEDDTETETEESSSEETTETPAEAPAEKREAVELTPQQKLAYAYRDAQAATAAYGKEMDRRKASAHNQNDADLNGANNLKIVGEGLDDITAAVDKTSIGQEYALAQQIFHEQAVEVARTDRAYMSAEAQLGQLQQDYDKVKGANDPEHRADNIAKMKAIKEKMDGIQSRMDGIVSAVEASAKDVYRDHKAELKDIDAKTDNLANPGDSSSEMAGNYRGVGSWKQLETPEGNPADADQPSGEGEGDGTSTETGENDETELSGEESGDEDEGEGEGGEGESVEAGEPTIEAPSMYDQKAAEKAAELRDGLKAQLDKLAPELAELYARNRRLVKGINTTGDRKFPELAQLLKGEYPEGLSGVSNKELWQKANEIYGKALGGYLYANGQAQLIGGQEQIQQQLATFVEQLNADNSQALTEFAADTENGNKTQEEVDAEKERLQAEAAEQLNAENRRLQAALQGEIDADFLDRFKDIYKTTNEMIADKLDNGTICRKIVHKVLNNKALKVGLLVAGGVGLAATGVGLATGAISITYGLTAAGFATGAAKGALMGGLMSRQDSRHSAIHGFLGNEIPDAIRNLNILNSSDASAVGNFIMQQYAKANQADASSNKKRTAISAGVGGIIGGFSSGIHVNQVVNSTTTEQVQTGVEVKPAEYNRDLEIGRWHADGSLNGANSSSDVFASQFGGTQADYSPQFLSDLAQRTPGVTWKPGTTLSFTGRLTDPLNSNLSAMMSQYATEIGTTLPVVTELVRAVTSEVPNDLFTMLAQISVLGAAAGAIIPSGSKRNPENGASESGPEPEPTLPPPPTTPVPPAPSPAPSPAPGPQPTAPPPAPAPAPSGAESNPETPPAVAQTEEEAIEAIYDGLSSQNDDLFKQLEEARAGNPDFADEQGLAGTIRDNEYVMQAVSDAFDELSLPENSGKTVADILAQKAAAKQAQVTAWQQANNLPDGWEQTQSEATLLDKARQSIQAATAQTPQQQPAPQPTSPPPASPPSPAGNGGTPEGQNSSPEGEQQYTPTNKEITDALTGLFQQEQDKIQAQIDTAKAQPSGLSDSEEARLLGNLRGFDRSKSLVAEAQAELNAPENAGKSLEDILTAKIEAAQDENDKGILQALRHNLGFVRNELLQQHQQQSPGETQA